MGHRVTPTLFKRRRTHSQAGEPCSCSEVKPAGTLPAAAWESPEVLDRFARLARALANRLGRRENPLAFLACSGHSRHCSSAAGQDSRHLGRAMRSASHIRVGVAWLLWLFLAISSAASFAQAQRFPEVYAETAARIREERARHAERMRARVARQSISAHAHLRTATGIDLQGSTCPVQAALSTAFSRIPKSKSTAKPFEPRYAPPLARWQGTAPQTDTAQGIFSDYVSGSIIQSKCIHCHVAGGVSGHTRLVLTPSASGDSAQTNLETFKRFVTGVANGADTILSKIQGVSHGGGVQVASGSVEFANMERFVRLLEALPPVSDGTTDALLRGVTMASPEKTLRRAALIFAGRIPSEPELRSVRDGSQSSLRRAIKGLMTGSEFHEFLIRAGNDRLLTDRHLSFVLDFRTETDLVDLANLNWSMAKRAIERGSNEATDDPTYARWEEAMQYGLARSPLELIAYVIEEERPYTEILTADYLMANPMTARAYGSSVTFTVEDNFREFQPAKIENYFLTDNSKVTEYHREYGTRIINSGNLEIEFPHAGILNTRAFLRRYPTTETNRNRGRAYWTIYHFLGFDIQKVALRTTDIAASDNPTLNNPACTSCHSLLDPVAGTFQNYSEDGAYRNSFGGRDALPESYKYPPDETVSPYREGDTWYRDMLAPGFNDARAQASGNSLQWLARQITSDPRFSEAAVKFWWSAVTGSAIAALSGGSSGRAAEAQFMDAELARLAQAFRTGIDGGHPYNAKDLLVEIVLSPWFRAESVAGDDPARAAALRSAGGERLLTPEELVRKTESIMGYRWGRRLSGFLHDVDHLDGEGDGHGGAYEMLYGGIDSDGVPVRAREITPLMAAVAQSHALRVSCAVVQREFYMWPEHGRRLFGGIDAYTTPDSDQQETQFEVRSDVPTPLSWDVHAPSAGEGILRVTLTGNQPVETADSGNLLLRQVRLRNSASALVNVIDLGTFPAGSCGSPRGADYALADGCSLDVLLDFPERGDYRVEVVAWHENAPANSPAPRLAARLLRDGVALSGSERIRRKLVDLHWKLFGVRSSPDSPDIEAAYRLFEEVWERKRRTEGKQFHDSQVECPIEDTAYFEGLVNDSVIVDEWGNSEIAWDRVQAYWDFEMDDSMYAVRSWVVVLAYLMTDYRYLYL